MKSFTATCVLAFVAVVSVANAKCTPMDPKKKAMYEEVYETEFMGCSLSMREGMTAMARLNWLTPAGAQPLVEMDNSASSEMDSMSKMKGGAMMTAGVKVAAASVSRSGTSTVPDGCIASLAPDFVAMVLAESSSPKEANAKFAAACKNVSSRMLNATTRFDADTIATAQTLLCLVGTILSIFFPAIDATLLTTLKTLVGTLFNILPCPSGAPMTRMIAV